VIGGSKYRAVHRVVLRGVEWFWHDLRFRDLYRSGKKFGLMHWALVFAALAFLTMIPLLIVIAAANPASHHGLSEWVIDGMDLSDSSAKAVQKLFSPIRALATASAFSILVLSISGVSFAATVQSGFERIWELPASPQRKIWRQAVWLAAFIAYIYAEAMVDTVTDNDLLGAAVVLVLGIAFFSWGPRFLTGGRVSYLATMPGAIATIAGLFGLLVFSSLVFNPLIAQNATRYGSLGTVLILQSWLIGIGWVLYGSQLFGRWFYDVWVKGRRGGGEEQDPGSQNTPPG
jgi:membrane protein